MKKHILLMIILLPLVCFGVTRQVALDGSQAYTSIQAAINDAVSGDMILVHPGRYLENIDLSNKSGLTLTSLEYTTADTSYISSTIIDGSRENTSTILCYENVLNCEIRGFTITGGSGYDYWHGSSPYQIFGGGIFFYSNCNVNLFNLNICNNRSSIGGGISILASNTVFMSNVNIYNNFARYHGGGLAMSSSIHYIPQIIFDQVHRCSIYNNFAQWGLDIHWHYTHFGTVEVYLKKFTVSQWERYYASYYDSRGLPSPYTVFDVQEAYLQPIEADLYVSPGGDDDNDGLSAATALRTPSIAMQRIASNPDNPRTVHLSAGTHHNLFGGEYLPIVIKDYCVLQGVSQLATRLYGENMLEGTGVISMGIEGRGMTMRDLSITTTRASAVFAWDVFDFLAKNICIENCTVDKWIFALGLYEATYTLNNITVRDNLAHYAWNGMHIQGSIAVLDNVLIMNNQTESLSPNWWNQAGGCFDAYFKDSLTIRNSKFINNTHYSVDGWENIRLTSVVDNKKAVVNVDNCLFASNTTYGGARDISADLLASVNFTNCTFANNVGTFFSYLRIAKTDSARIVNCIFANNSAQHDLYVGAETYVENCLFSRSDNFVQMGSYGTLNWGNNNITGVDPLFSGTDPLQPSYYFLFADDVNGYSPAIDAGTMEPNILPQGYAIPPYDAFGNKRVYGNSIDIGCFESPGYTDNDDAVYPAIGSFTLTSCPNPFRVFTNIKVSMPQGGFSKAGSANINIYNIKGQKVKTIALDPSKAGEQFTYWDGRDSDNRLCSSGIYLLNLTVNGRNVSSKKVTFVR